MSEDHPGGLTRRVLLRGAFLVGAVPWLAAHGVVVLTLAEAMWRTRLAIDSQICNGLDAADIGAALTGRRIVACSAVAHGRRRAYLAARAATGHLSPHLSRAQGALVLVSAPIPGLLLEDIHAAFRTVVGELPLDVRAICAALPLPRSDGQLEATLILGCRSPEALASQTDATCGKAL